MAIRNAGDREDKAGSCRTTSAILDIREGNDDQIETLKKDLQPMFAEDASAMVLLCWIKTWAINHSLDSRPASHVPKGLFCFGEREFMGNQAIQLDPA